jgi:hypothetical protein
MAEGSSHWAYYSNPMGLVSDASALLGGVQRLNSRAQIVGPVPSTEWTDHERSPAHRAVIFLDSPRGGLAAQTSKKRLELLRSFLRAVPPPAGSSFSVRWTPLSRPKNGNPSLLFVRPSRSGHPCLSWPRGSSFNRIHKQRLHQRARQQGCSIAAYSHAPTGRVSHAALIGDTPSRRESSFSHSAIFSSSRW